MGGQKNCLSWPKNCFGLVNQVVFQQHEALFVEFSGSLGVKKWTKREFAGLRPKTVRSVSQAGLLCFGCLTLPMLVSNVQLAVAMQLQGKKRR